jgi:hypothetical protein
MHAATVLRFAKFPTVSNRPQQTVDGRAWQIVKVEAPFCWARVQGSKEPFCQYLIQGCGPEHGGQRQPDPVSEPDALSVPEGLSEPELVSAPIPTPHEQDERPYRIPRGKTAFIEIGRRAIAAGVLAVPE